MLFKQCLDCIISTFFFFFGLFAELCEYCLASDDYPKLSDRKYEYWLKNEYIYIYIYI